MPDPETSQLRLETLYQAFLDRTKFLQVPEYTLEEWIQEMMAVHKVDREKAKHIVIEVLEQMALS